VVRRGAYRSDKRRKELARLKKQEEKRQRRMGLKVEEPTEEPETAEQPQAPESESA
jgi:hypothetical protein